MDCLNLAKNYKVGFSVNLYGVLIMHCLSLETLDSKPLILLAFRSKAWIKA